MADFEFALCASEGSARVGRFETPHGGVDTPAFLAVGTLATVKALDPRDLRALGASMILANGYHLHLRPGEDVVRALGGLHRFMQWDGPILTDSGGFQVFSLERLRRVSEEGVEFQSHVDGSRRFFTPERVIEIQRALGADVIMQLDHVIPGEATAHDARDASERSLRWLERSLRAFVATDEARGEQPQALFPVIHGGVHAAVRLEAAQAAAAVADWRGFAIGGLSVGEAKPEMYAVLDLLDQALPRERPRYLMGVGFPEDLIEGAARGVDLFDCVAPTRMGRTGTAFTTEGKLNIRNAALRLDAEPLDARCECSTCARFSRAYLRHLFVADELLGYHLLSLHNVHFLLSLMGEARTAISSGAFRTWSQDWLARYHSRSTATP
ncbi:MAG TPA: tRNA guanosine(34) transglycosylase Tgt [Gemmatimonadaceae bacterium]|nr:tRNA guanosine(34) transglycosylase Tgt [Gemmatimonadaceae bacterium]